MTFPLTERQADQLVADGLRASNLEAANAAGPAVQDQFPGPSITHDSEFLGLPIRFGQPGEHQPLPAGVTPAMWDEQRRDTLRDLYGVRHALTGNPEPPSNANLLRQLYDYNLRMRKHGTPLAFDQFEREWMNEHASRGADHAQRMRSQLVAEWRAAGLGQS